MAYPSSVPLPKLCGMRGGIFLRGYRARAADIRSPTMRPKAIFLFKFSNLIPKLSRDRLKARVAIRGRRNWKALQVHSTRQAVKFHRMIISPYRNRAIPNSILVFYLRQVWRLFPFFFSRKTFPASVFHPLIFDRTCFSLIKPVLISLGVV